MSKFPVVRFEHAALQIIDGDRGTNYPQKNEFQNSGHCVFLNTGNVTTDGFDFREVDFISEEKDALLRKGKASRKDIVLTTRGTVGNVAFYGDQIPFQHIRINSGMVLIRPDQKNIEPYYLYAFLRSDSFKKQVISNGSGSAQPQLPISALKNIEFPLPNIEKQREIAAIISALDAKIDCNNRINAELEAMAKTLYDYWFLQFDFPFDFAQGRPDVNGNPYKSSGGKMVYNSTLKGEIPAGWDVRKIGEIADVKAGGDKPNRFYVEKSKNFAIPIYSNGISNEGLYGYTDKAIIHRPSITVSARGTIGYTVLRLKPFVPIIRLIVLTPQDTNALKFLEESIKRIGFDNSGSVQKQLTVPQISEIPILYPAPNILEKYSNVFFSIVDKVELLKEQNIELNNLRDWLLPMLMNGQVTVA